MNKNLRFLLLMILVEGLLLTGAQLSSAQSTNWNVQNIGTLPDTNCLSVEVIDGRNDGMNRVYATTATAVYEWSHNGSSWSYLPVATGLAPDLQSLAAGNGRNDGVNRIYIAEWAWDGSIWEASWNGSSWATTLVANVPGGTHASGLNIGSGRNDGVDRLYVSGSFGVIEYSWNGSSWSQNSVSGLWSETYGFVGNTRNDGVDRLLFNASCQQEASWNGSNYNVSSITNCSTSQGADAVEIADGRNDGVSRIYANTELNGRIEYTWNGSSFVANTITTNSQRGDIHLAALQSDQNTRVYMTNSTNGGLFVSGPLLEYTWNSGNSTWDSTDVLMNSVSGATAFISTGIGRNDDTLRMYTPNFSTGGMYEITAVNPNNLCIGFSASNAGTSNATCLAADGSASALGLGGAGNYVYQWDATTGNQTTATATGLSAGNYTCVVTDANGCSQSVQLTVNATNVNITASLTIAPASCGANNGSANAAATSGTAPYTYQWDAATGNQTGQIASNLAAGSYTVTITDANGCSSDVVAAISNIGAPTLTMNQTNNNCFGYALGDASVAVNGGMPPYTYLWSTGDTTASISGLAAGTYSVTVSDGSGCQAVTTVTITENPIVAGTFNNTPDNGSGNGTIDLTPTGGTPPYTFSWNTGATTEDLSGLTAGTYTVVILDAFDCGSVETTVVNLAFSVAQETLEPITLKCYPNPASSLVKLAFGTFDDYQIQLYDMQGKLLQIHEAENTNTFEIRVENLSNGLYFIKVLTNEQQATTKLLIKH